MNLYISDLHFGHTNIIKHELRPFADRDEMDKTMIELWNGRVGKDDHVYIVGDFSYKSDKSDEWYLEQLRGHKHLIPGNHDRRLLANDTALSYFDSISSIMEIVDGDFNITLCHYPMVEWNRSEHGSYLIYGHIHNRMGESYQIMKNIERALNAAACINNYMPVSFNELIRNNRDFINKMETGNLSTCEDE